MTFRSSLGVLCLALFAFTASAQTTNWTGAATPNANWSATGNWLNDTPPSAGSIVSFDGNSAQDLTTNNDIAGLTFNGIVISSVSMGSPVSIGGNTFILGNGGIDMSIASQPLSIALA